MNLKFKRNYPIILLLVFAITLFGIGLGNQRVIAYTTRTGSGVSLARLDAEGWNISNNISLFDQSIAHSIQILLSDEDYEEMVTAYQQIGLKEYFQADIIIDGVQINDVGLRLKGNASLRTALGGSMGERGGMGAEGGMVNKENRPGNAEGVARPEPPAGFNIPADGEQAEARINPSKMPRGGAPAGMGKIAEEDIKVPFLIKFDEYVDGQTYQGYSSIAIRSYGVSMDAAMLQEPVTNDIVRLAGLPATQTAYAGFKINNKPEKLYVISEIIDKTYLEKYFENADGILYKAEVGSTLSYVDENPSSYAKSFSQESRINDADLAPLIAFMRFLDQADDTSFESDLPKWLDVDSFATYLALNNLLVNTDSIIGMNNNYYLYFDETSEKFTLLMWDANESLAKLGGGATYNLFFANSGGMDGGGRGGGMGGDENVLMERFMANANFKSLYEQKLKEVYELVFFSGVMVENMERYSQLIHSVNGERGLVDINAYDQAVQKVLDFISQREEYFATTELFSS